MSPIANRYEFLFLFDVQDGNPNGDPDADNAPRTDPENLHGLATDGSIKRKVRDYISQAREGVPGYGTFIAQGVNLNRLIREAHDAVNPAVDFTETETPADDATSPEEGKGKKGKSKSKAKGGAKGATKLETDKARQWLCSRYFDVRTFGAVMSTGANAGQVTGPVQISISRSVDPVLPIELCLTRVAVTDGSKTDTAAQLKAFEDAAAQDTLRTMGRKTVIPYGLYVCRGFISANLAADTGFSEADLETLWEALANMFDHCRSAGRGFMACRGLYVFKHVGTDTDAAKRSNQAKLGCAPAHALLDLGRVVSIKRIDPGVSPRSFADYNVTVDYNRLPAGVELHELHYGAQSLGENAAK